MSVRGNCWLTLGLAFCLIATRRRTAQTPFSHMPEKLSAPIPVRPVDFFETIQADIRQIAASFSLMLRHFGLLRNPEAPMRLVDGRRAGPTPFSEWGRVEFSLIETHLSCKLERTHDNRTPYAVDVTGGGRSSAISRRMSAKRFLGMATSAIWNAT
jgi:hypothetical protein